MFIETLFIKVGRRESIYQYAHVALLALYWDREKKQITVW